MMKTTFYFTLKHLFVLAIFKFLKFTKLRALPAHVATCHAACCIYIYIYIYIYTHTHTYL